jgi:hypothetical protein
MIRPEDFDFHFKPDSHYSWAETLALAFSVPEANINGIVYVLSRPVIGVTMCDITIMDRIAPLWDEAIYVDNQQHLPCPKSMLAFELPNGLSFKVIEPLKLYQLKYTGIDDTEFDLQYRALHEPFDLNDPAMDPNAAKRVDPAWDNSWNGHYEATYHITGTLKIRGKSYTVNCYDTGDRSWGPRPERDNGPVVWWHASFGESLTIHVLTGHDIAKTPAFGPHISGYVMEDGQNYGIVSSEGLNDYARALPMGGMMTVTDIRGKTFTVTYSTVNGCYWAPAPSNAYVQGSFRANLDGRIGHGVQQLGLSRAYQGRNRDAILSRY